MKASKLIALAGTVSLAFAASGTFNVLSFNVAGIGGVAGLFTTNGVPGGKANAANHIGQKFAAGDWDVIHIQEDFSYHDKIYEKDNHPFRTEPSGDVPFGSGLNTLSKFSFTGLQRVKWNHCNVNQGDCLTPKGYTHMRMNIAGGVTIDFYNLHAEAGNEKGDYEARRSNMEQLANHIKSASAGQAVIVFGDTNSLFSDKEDNIRILGTEDGLRDAWVELRQGGITPSDAPVCPDPTTRQDCEAIDKVLYRGGDAVNLTATAHAYVSDRFLQPNGNRLSDHNPVAVDFAWSA